jgi:signal transduction histidine kinase
MGALLAGGLSLLTGPAGKYILIVVAFIAWTVYQRDQAADRARETCQAETLRETIKELQRQRRAAEEAMKRAAEQAAKTDEELATLRKAYDEALSSIDTELGSASCAIPDDVLERLRNIK